MAGNLKEIEKALFSLEELEKQIIEEEKLIDEEILNCKKYLLNPRRKRTKKETEMLDFKIMPIIIEKKRGRPKLLTEVIPENEIANFEESAILPTRPKIAKTTLKKTIVLDSADEPDKPNDEASLLKTKVKSKVSKKKQDEISALVTSTQANNTRSTRRTRNTRNNPPNESNTPDPKVEEEMPMEVLEEPKIKSPLALRSSKNVSKNKKPSEDLFAASDDENPPKRSKISSPSPKKVPTPVVSPKPTRKSLRNKETESDVKEPEPKPTSTEKKTKLGKASSIAKSIKMAGSLSKYCTPVKSKIKPPSTVTKTNSAYKKIKVDIDEKRKKEEEALRIKLKEEEALRIKLKEEEAMKKKQEIMNNKKEILRKKNVEKAQVAAIKEALEKERREELEKLEKEKEEKERLLREEMEKEKEKKILKKKQLNQQKAQEVEERRLKEEAIRLAKLKEQEEEQKRNEELKLKQQEHAERLQQQRKLEEEKQKQAIPIKKLEKKENIEPIIDMDDYGIDDDDLNDDEDKDDEEAGNKRPIPLWAQRNNRKQECKIQEGIPADYKRMYFGLSEKTPQLKEFFGKKTVMRARTSSANWQ